MKERSPIFQSRGLPKRLQMLFLMSGIVWISAIVIQWYKTSQNFKLTILICFFYSFMVMIYVIFIFEGFRLFIKVYSTYIEGCAEIDESLKNVHIPLDEIYSISSYTIGMAPHLAIKTQQGNTFNFYMGAKKVTLAKKAIQNIKPKNYLTIQ